MSKFEEYRVEPEQRPRLLPRIRPATAEDLAAIARLIADRDGRTDLEHLQQTQARFLTETVAVERGCLLVAIHEETVTGFGRATLFGKADLARARSEDPDAPPAPPGWYLTGVIVDPEHRRRGIGAALTRSRIEWVATRATEVYYFANAKNRVSIELHESADFREISRSFSFPDVEFEGGNGVLFRADLGGKREEC